MEREREKPEEESSQQTANEGSRDFTKLKQPILVIGAVLIAVVVAYLTSSRLFIPALLQPAEGTMAMISREDLEVPVEKPEDFTIHSLSAQMINLKPDPNLPSELQVPPLLNITVALKINIKGMTPEEQERYLSELDERETEFRDMIGKMCAERTANEILSVDGQVKLGRDIQERIEAILSRKGRIQKVVFHDLNVPISY